MWVRMNSRHVVVFLRSGAGRQTTTFENVAHSLIADVITQFGKGAGNAIVAPGAILSGHADNPVFEVLVDTGPPRRLALLRAIEFVSGELAMPPQNGIGFDDGGNFLQGLSCLVFCRSRPESGVPRH